MEIGMLNFGFRLLVTALAKETYFKRSGCVFFVIRKTLPVAQCTNTLSHDFKYLAIVFFSANMYF